MQLRTFGHLLHPLPPKSVVACFPHPLRQVRRLATSLHAASVLSFPSTVHADSSTALRNPDMPLSSMSSAGDDHMCTPCWVPPLRRGFTNCLTLAATTAIAHAFLLVRCFSRGQASPGSTTRPRLKPCELPRFSIHAVICFSCGCKKRTFRQFYTTN